VREFEKIKVKISTFLQVMGKYKILDFSRCFRIPLCNVDKCARMWIKIPQKQGIKIF
jgi:hypothetical protein